MNLELNKEVSEQLAKEKEIHKDAITEPVELAKIWIKKAIQNACVKPKLGQNGLQPTVNPSMEEHGKFVKVSNCLMSAKDGIAVIEDDTFKWLKSKYEEAQLPMQSGISDILIAIRNKINEAEVDKK